MAESVRCPVCGSVASVWARWCATCRADLSFAEVVEDPPQALAPVPVAGAAPDSAAAGPVPVRAPAEVEGLGRRRRPRRGDFIVALVAVLALVGALAGGVVALSGSGGSAWPASVRDLAVVAIRQDRLIRFTNETPGGVPLGAHGGQAAFSSGPIEVSGAAVVVENGTAVAFEGTDRVVLGAADYAVVNIDDTGVWLVRDGPGSTATVTLVAITGDQELSFSRLPPGTVVLADAGAGLLLRHGSDPPEVWVPGSGRVLYRFPASFADLVAAGDPFAPHVAWLDDHCTGSGSCGLHLTNMATFGDQLVPPPAGSSGFLDGGAFSPDDTPLAFDDTVLAAFVSDPRHPRELRIDLIPTPNIAGARLSGDLPVVPSGPDPAPTGHWAPAGSPEALVVGAGRRLLAVDPDGTVTSIPLQSSGPFAVL